MRFILEWVRLNYLGSRELSVNSRSMQILVWVFHILLIIMYAPVFDRLDLVSLVDHRRMLCMNSLNSQLYSPIIFFLTLKLHNNLSVNLMSFHVAQFKRNYIKNGANEALNVYHLFNLIVCFL